MDNKDLQGDNKKTLKPDLKEDNNDKKIGNLEKSEENQSKNNKSKNENPNKTNAKESSKHPIEAGITNEKIPTKDDIKTNNAKVEDKKESKFQLQNTPNTADKTMAKHGDNNDSLVLNKKEQPITPENIKKNAPIIDDTNNINLKVEDKKSNLQQPNPIEETKDKVVTKKHDESSILFPDNGKQQITQQNNEEKPKDKIIQNDTHLKDEKNLQDEPSNNKLTKEKVTETNANKIDVLIPNEKKTNAQFENSRNEDKTIAKTQQNVGVKNVNFSEEMHREELCDIQNKSILSVEEIDQRARNAPECCRDSYEKLNDYLMKDFSKESDSVPEWLRVRSLLAWLCAQNISEAVTFQSSNAAGGKSLQDTPASLLVKLKNKECSYANAFSVLCQKAQIECKVVSGYVKDGNYKPGDDVTKRGQSEWNIVKTNNQQYIVNPLWASGNTSDNDKIVETQKTPEKQQVVIKPSLNEQSIMSFFDEFFFRTPPEKYIYLAFPNNPEDQILEEPWDIKMFQKKAYLLKTFLALDLNILSENKGKLKSSKGVKEIMLSAPYSTAKSIQIDFSLTYKPFKSTNEKTMEKTVISNTEMKPTDALQEQNAKKGKGKDKKDEDKVLADNSKEKNMPKVENNEDKTNCNSMEIKNISRYVIMIRNEQLWTFQIQFPVVGIYTLNILGGKNGYLEPLTTFQLACYKPKDDCIPLPIDAGITGFGPGPKLQAVGLLYPSHKNGKYSADSSRPVVLTFFAKGLKEVKATLKATYKNSDTGGFETVCHDSWVVASLNRKDQYLRISVTIQQPGEYVLGIIYDDNAELCDNVVCNYLLIYDCKQGNGTREQRHARKELFEVLDILPVEGITSESLIHTVNVRVSQCLDVGIPEDDDDITLALSKLEQIISIRQDIAQAFHQNRTFVSSVISAVNRARKDQKNKFLKRKRHEEKQQKAIQAKSDLVSGDLDRRGYVLIGNVIKSRCEH